MTITSKRENVLAYIKATTLPLINGIGHYNNKIITISRRIILPTAFDDHLLPAVMIRDDIVTFYQPLTAQEYVTGSMEDLTDGMGIGLIGVMSTGGNQDDIDTGKISTECNKLHSDMMIAMLSDTTLGGNCEAVTLVSSKNSIDFAGHNGLAVCFQVYSINYIFSPTTGTPVT